METQSHDSAYKTRLEDAREAALGTLSRAKETLQVAATTVPVWARDVETRAVVQADALLRRVGLVRIAAVEAKPAVAVAVEAAPAVAVEAEAPAAVTASESAEETTDETDGVEAAAERVVADAEVSPEATVAADPAGDRGGRRRRR